MILMILVLAACSIWIEIKLIRKISPLKKLMERYSLVGVAISIAISALLGSVFGAAGVIVLIAGLASTVGAEPFRRITNNQVKAIRLKVSDTGTWVRDFFHTYRYVFSFFKYLFIVLSSPIWIPVRMDRKKRLKELNQQGATP